MKIAYLISGPAYTPAWLATHPSGVAQHVRRVLKALKRQGHTVEIICTFDGGTDLNFNLNKDRRRVNIRSKYRDRVPSWLWATGQDLRRFVQDRMATRHLRQRLIEFKPEAIIEFRVFGFPSSTIVAKTLNVPVVLDIHEPLEAIPAQGSLIRPVLHRLERRRILRADRVICVSEALKNYYVKALALGDGERVLVQHMCADLDRFDIPNRDEVADLRAQLGVSKRIVIGYVGWFTPYSGVDLLIQALSVVKDRQFALLLVGDGVELSRDHLRQRAQDLGIEDSVFLPGFVSEESLASYMASMDIAVMANSNWYGSPTKIFEYGAMRRTIVAPTTAPVREVMKHKVDGYLIQPGKVEALATAWQNLAKDESLAQQVADNFHNRVLREHTLKHMGKRISNFVNSIS